MPSSATPYPSCRRYGANAIHLAPGPNLHFINTAIIYHLYNIISTPGTISRRRAQRTGTIRRRLCMFISMTDTTEQSSSPIVGCDRLERTTILHTDRMIIHRDIDHYRNNNGSTSDDQGVRHSRKTIGPNPSGRAMVCGPAPDQTTWLNSPPDGEYTETCTGTSSIVVLVA